MRRDDLVQQIRLLRLLEESGFVGAEDVICREGCPPGFTARYVESKPLREVAQEFGDPALVEILCLLCQSLAYLHSLDFLHGDLKPENILVEVEPGGLSPRITDLGLAVRRGAQFPIEIRGSHGYIAPEVLEGQILTEATDVYSFGMILSELAGFCSLQALASGLADLARFCTDPSPVRRPQTFWDVHHRLSALSVQPHSVAGRAGFYPPLRHAGLRMRMRLIGRVFESEDGRSPCVCLVGGPTGIGKSKLIREYCLERQLDGERTLRITGVESGAALNAILGDWIEQASQLAFHGKHAPSQWVFVEVAPDCRLAAGDLEDLLALGIAHNVRMVVECRESADSRWPPRVEMVRVPPLSVRECIASSSHLTDRPTLSIANGGSLRVATGGIPCLMRHCLKNWLLGGRPGQPAEPVSFDRLTPPVFDYWRQRFLALPAESQTLLANASIFHHAFLPSWLHPSVSGIQESIPVLESLALGGWLVRGGAETGPRRYHYASRSARNSVRRHLGRDWLKTMALGFLNQAERGARLEGNLQELWELRRLAERRNHSPTPAELAAKARTLVDWKQAVHAALCGYPRHGSDSQEHRASEARSISDGYAHLGCSRRQIRWAGIALREAQRQSVCAVPSLDEARWRCALLDIAGDLFQKERYLEQMIESLPPTVHAHLRGFLLSELGTLFLTRSDFKRAQSACHQAHHLLKPTAPVSEEFARNLNRLGLILLYSGADQAAKKYLDQCRSVSMQNGWDEVGWLCRGNLGLVARAMGDPLAARGHLRRAADHYRLAQDSPTYLQALSNQVPCYVDLGQGFAALRAARLAVALAEIIADPVRSGYAHDLLGWVLTMQGHLRPARASLETAIRIRLRNGNTIGAARVRLNLARLSLVAADNSKAEDDCRAALAVFTREGDLEGYWEGNRLLARAAIARDAYDDAENLLRLIPLEHPLLSRRDETETMLAWLDLSLWTGDITRAKDLANRLQENPMVEHVHPLRCELGRLLGHLRMAKHEYDQSLEILGRTATECRLSGRVDHSIVTLVVMSLLAKEMGNWRVAVRYVNSAESILNRIRGELQ
jgi:tetratricopeptide (TPR) repeat protein